MWAPSTGFFWVVVAGVIASGCAKNEPTGAPSPAASSREPVAPAPAPPRSPEPTPGASALVAAAAGIEQACTSVCERASSLKCKNAAGCVQNCVAMAAGTPCTDAFRAFYGCLVREPVAHWECGDDGVAAIREGYCDKEQERAVGCLETNVKR